MLYPFFGSRQMTIVLQREDISIGRYRIRRLMRLMGLQAIYRQPRTSDPQPQHKIYPYLLRKLPITEANHVWCAGITCIPMQKDFLYLVAVMDWATRHVLLWCLSNTMDADFCVEALKEAINKYGPPKIFNTDQGSQFTSGDVIEVLTDAEVAISMDGRGRYLDNIFIERLWLCRGSCSNVARGSLVVSTKRDKEIEVRRSIIPGKRANRFHIISS